MHNHGPIHHNKDWRHKNFSLQVHLIGTKEMKTLMRYLVELCASCNIVIILFTCASIFHEIGILCDIDLCSALFCSFYKESNYEGNHQSSLDQLSWHTHCTKIHTDMKVYIVIMFHIVE